MDHYIVLIFLIAILGLSWESTNVAPPPALTLAALDVEVNETEYRNKNLYAAGPLVDCTDEDPTRAFISSVTPSTPCGARCFNLLPCSSSGSAANSSEYCLYYQPSQGSLQYTRAPKYTLTIGCTDDVEATTTQTLTVTVVPNTPPEFNPPSPLNVAKTVSGTSTSSGTVIHSVLADDIDQDAVYYTMTTNPYTPYLTIGQADGQIYATNDLRFMCLDSVQASVTAEDPYNHQARGPLNIALNINPSNKAPYVTNLDTKVTVDENVGQGFQVLKLSAVDPNVYNKLNIHMWSTSNAGMEQYTLDTSGPDPVLKTKINPNYERMDTRSVQLYFDVDDGYCKANKTYSLTIDIKDINEPPEYQPNNVQSIEVYEENVNFQTGLYVSDPDINDVHIYSKSSGSNLFAVDPTNGNIYSLSELDIDTNKPFKEYTVVTNVTDRGGRSSTATVKITVFDKNDQRPYFISKSYTFTATECTDPGTVIDTLTGDDDDSYYNNNDKIYFGGGGGKMAVMSNGEVVLTQHCINGESFTADQPRARFHIEHSLVSSSTVPVVGSATISDQGIYPGPLQGIPATISLTCGPCPPSTPAPTPTPPATAAVTTKPSTPTVPTTAKPVQTSKDGYLDGLFQWLIPAIFGGLAFLALTAFLIYRYCCPFRNIFAGLCKRRPKRPQALPTLETPETPKKPATPKVNPPPAPLPQHPPPKVVTPAPQPPPPPSAPPAPPEPEPEPYIYGFWRETYTDQDIVNQPSRSTKPEAVENMPSEDVIPRGNAPPPANLRLGNPGIGQHSLTVPNSGANSTAT